MKESIRPVKKPSGCLKALGLLLTIGSVLFILFWVLMVFVSEEEMNENRAEYAASEKEYQQAMEEYEKDSVRLRAEFNRILALRDKAEKEGDTALGEALTDSLAKYAEPDFVPRGAIGFNIGGAFFLFFALCGLIPLIIGILLLVNYRHRKRRYEQAIMSESLSQKGREEGW